MVKLKSYQSAHVEQIIEILSRFQFYIDGSPPGTGKTFTTCYIAKSLDYPIMVVCPATAKGNWEQVITSNGIRTWNLNNGPSIITYESLRGITGKQPNHHLLSRTDIGDKVIYSPTDSLNTIIRHGTLFVFDECQNLKNNNTANMAVSSIMRAIYSAGGGESTSSRAAFLSGSIMDKEEQATNFLRMVGFIVSKRLYSKVDEKIILSGLQEVINWAKMLDPYKTKTFLDENPPVTSSKIANSQVFELFRTVIRPKIMSIMNRPIETDINGNPTSNLDIKNGFYVMEEEERDKYIHAIGALAKALRWNPTEGTVRQEQGNLGNVTLSLRAIEEAKVSIISRLVLQDLNTSYKYNGKTCYYKIIVYLTYYTSIDMLKAQFENFRIIELTGRVPEAKRWEGVKLFNQDNDEYRLIIANPIVGGVSLNLQDKTGYRSRKTYIIPGYRVNESHQATMRTFREGLIGTAYVRFVYGLSNKGIEESKILTAMNRKGGVMRKVLAEQDMIFPDQYQNEYERPIDVE